VHALSRLAATERGGAAVATTAPVRMMTGE
jgi:hypothetical protein